MPLFKIQDQMRSRKVTVCADTLTDLIPTAVRKLNLPQDEQSYHVHDDSDGSWIDDDDSLTSLHDFCASKGHHLHLIILPVNVRWAPPQNEPLILVEPSTPKSPIPVTPTIEVTPTALPSLPFKDLIGELNKALLAPQHLRQRALTRARRSVIRGLTTKLKHRSLPPGVMKQVCGRIYSSCPDAFMLHIKDSNSSCFPEFVKSLYNAINYARDAEADGSTPRRGRKTVSDSLENSVPYLCIDPNGCAAEMWEPMMSETDAEEQESLRTSLLALPPTDLYALDLVKKTYPLQRHQINRARTMRQWAEVFQTWSILERHSAFMIHANLLMGKNNTTTWHEELDASLVVRDFFVHYIEDKLTLSKRDIKIKSWLDTSKEASESCSSRLPLTISIFLCVIEQFKEKDSDFFLLVCTELSREEILSSAIERSQCPLLVVQGSSIFDQDAKAFVAVRGTFLISCSSVIQGVLVMLLAYFMFNISYPKTISRTLEFIQRYILRVNPLCKPTRKGGKGNTVNSAVASFTRRLAGYEAVTSRWVSDDS